MDSLTHAVTGIVALLAIPSRPASRWSIAAAATVASLPDIDILFAQTPLQFLLLHRGITHALLVLPLLALLGLAILYPLWQRRAPGHWSLRQAYGFALALLLLHVGLDCATTYGTMIFLPFSDVRVRLNGMFIIDLALLLPLLAAFLCYRRAPRCMIAALLWILLYPAAATCLRLHLQHEVSARLLPPDAQNSTVLPDAFSPFRWRLLYAMPHQGQICRQGLDWRGRPVTPVECGQALPLEMQERLRASSRSSRTFLDFSLLPLLETATENGREEWRIYDWRFGSELPSIRALMQMRAHGDKPFLLRIRPDAQGHVLEERLTLSGAHKDSSWSAPTVSGELSWYHWLLGLR